MRRTIKCLLTGLLILSSVSIIHSQNRTSSPFSRYGLGELYPQGFGRNTAMGGTGIGLRSTHYLNNMNPAAYSAADSMSFFFDSGLEGKMQSFSAPGGSQSFSDINFDYFAMGFSLGKKGGVLIGLKPASNAGYLFESLQQADSEAHLMQIEGSGNITSFYGGFAYNITPRLSLGINGSFWFGNLKHTAIQEFVNDPNAYMYGTKTEHHVSNFMLDFGAQYVLELDRDRSFIFGATFRPKAGINGESSTLTARGFSKAIDGELFVDSDTISSELNKWSSSIFSMPLKLGLGASYNIANKLTLAADYTLEQWADTNFPDEATETTNATYTALGAEFIPNERTGTKYFHRIRYRAGLHHKADYIKLNGYQVKDFGMSFGLGLPLGRSKTSVNLGYQFGKIGTSEKNQLKESYNRFTLSFTMHEAWFFKRKFD